MANAVATSDAPGGASLAVRPAVERGHDRQAAPDAHHGVVEGAERARCGAGRRLQRIDDRHARRHRCGHGIDGVGQSTGIGCAPSRRQPRADGNTEPRPHTGDLACSESGSHSLGSGGPPGLTACHHREDELCDDDAGHRHGRTPVGLA